MKKGFTLVEVLVVVTMIMMIMVSIGGVMTGVFGSQSKNKAMDKITQNGNWILAELKKNILNADSSTENGEKFTCPIGVYDNSIVITNVKDGDKTTISCFLDSTTNSYKIASVSGKAVGTTIYLFQQNNDLRLKDCTNFVTCSTTPSLQLSNVKFNFNIEAGVDTLISKTTKDFSVDVTLRN